MRSNSGSCYYVSAAKLPHFGPCKSTFKRRVTYRRRCNRRFPVTVAEIRRRMVYIMQNCRENDRSGGLLFKFCSGRKLTQFRWRSVGAGGRGWTAKRFPSRGRTCEGHGNARTVSPRLMQSRVASRRLNENLSTMKEASMVSPHSDKPRLLRGHIICTHIFRAKRTVLAAVAHWVAVKSQLRAETPISHIKHRPKSYARRDLIGEQAWLSLLRNGMES